jgi:hypothetical protein
MTFGANAAPQSTPLIGVGSRAEPSIVRRLSGQGVTCLQITAAAATLGVLIAGESSDAVRLAALVDEACNGAGHGAGVAGLDGGNLPVGVG